MPRSDRVQRMLDPGKRQFMRMHVRDILSSVTWTASDATARGIYLSLLFHSFLAPEGILYGTDDDLRALCGCSEDEWDRAWPRIKKKFALRSGGVCNSRVRKEIAHQLRRSAKARLSVEKRWGRYDRIYERNTKGIHRARARAGSGSGSSSSSDLSSSSKAKSTSTERKGGTDPPPEKAPAMTPDQLVGVYQEVLPELPCPKTPLAKGIKNTVRAAINRDGADPDSWRTYFQSVRELDLLMGRKTDWRASLLWLLGPKNRAKVESGSYADHRKPGGGSLAGANYDLDFDDVS